MGIVGGDQKKDGFVYFSSSSSKVPRLTLVFDKESNQLLSANWFVEEADPETHLQAVQQRYPNSKLDCMTMQEVDGAHGTKVRICEDKSSHLRVYMDESAKKVSGLTWVLRDDFDSIPKRRPTSH